jgi:hypothetical protein
MHDTAITFGLHRFIMRLIIQSSHLEGWIENFFYSSLLFLHAFRWKKVKRKEKSFHVLGISFSSFSSRSPMIYILTIILAFSLIFLVVIILWMLGELDILKLMLWWKIIDFLSTSCTFLLLLISWLLNKHLTVWIDKIIYFHQMKILSDPHSNMNFYCM